MKEKLKTFLERVCLGPRTTGEKIDLSYPPKEIRAKTVQTVETPEFNKYWLQLWLRKA
jgi:hypothetical protein